jgi:hypothetical protein
MAFPTRVSPSQAKKSTRGQNAQNVNFKRPFSSMHGSHKNATLPAPCHRDPPNQENTNEFEKKRKRKVERNPSP